MKENPWITEDERIELARRVITEQLRKAGEELNCFTAREIGRAARRLARRKTKEELIRELEVVTTNQSNAEH